MAHGVDFTAVPLKNDTHDLEAMARAITAKTRLVFIANPNNPTGTYVSRTALERFLRDVPPEIVVAVDEAYAEYADAPDYPRALELRRTRNASSSSAPSRRSTGWRRCAWGTPWALPSSSTT